MISTPPSQTPSCAVFNLNSTQIDQPLDFALDNPISEELHELLSLSEVPGLANGDSDPLALSLCKPSDQTDVDSTFVTLQGNQECTPESILTMDNPLTDKFTDLSSLLLDPVFLDSLSLMPSETLHPFLNSDAEKILDLESPESSISTLSPLSTSPSTPSDNVVPSCSPLPLERKRKSSSTDVDNVSSEPNVKKSTNDKYIERRKKNNVASQVSRAKRRQKSSELFAKEKELEKQNAELKIKVEEMTKEAEKLRKLLIMQLAH